MLREKQPSLKFVKKEDIAAMIYFLCSKEADQITGSNYIHRWSLAATISVLTYAIIFN